MIRSLLSIASGLGISVASVTVVMGVGIWLWPLHLSCPPYPGDWPFIIKDLKVGALLSLGLAWIVGAFAGGWVASRATRARWPAYFVGALVIVAAAESLPQISYSFQFLLPTLVFTAIAAHLASVTACMRSSKADESAA